MAWRLIAVVAVAGVLSGCSTGQPSGSGQEWQIDAHVEVMDGRTWVVGTHLVTIAPDASVDGKVAMGSTVHVSGRRIANGELLIDTVRVVDASPAPTAVQTPPRPNPTVAVRPPAPAPKKKSGEHGD